MKIVYFGSDVFLNVFSFLMQKMKYLHFTPIIRMKIILTKKI